MTTGLDSALEYHVVNSLGWPALRPLQTAAVEPLVSGNDALLVAPTAGGKTEAALFPLLTRMLAGNWTGTSIIYVTPLRALLNNLLPRLEQYTAWLGRTVGLWHGDVGQGERRRITVERPDILLTTPESLEAILVSAGRDHRAFFADIRAVVVDEIHSFAASDRGWHLLGVLERVQQISPHPMQRIGLSATVGNPEQLLEWLQGSATSRPRKVVEAFAPHNESSPEITLDYVGSLTNAAVVISRMHRGEKRLVFCGARADAEELAFELRQHGVTTFVSHSSLSTAERRISERAFAEATNCVIVATSTLELGIDIGDLDRVIQIDAPMSVASLLQRLGRTGRRLGNVRNMLVLATSDSAFLRAAGLLLLWSRGYVEPVITPPAPHHIGAQQLLALALQEGAYGRGAWNEWWSNLPFMAGAEEILNHLLQENFLVEDHGLLMIAPRAEKEFGRRNFMDLLASFTADLELTVLVGQKEIGSVSPLSVTKSESGDVQYLLLAGRSWFVETVDWEKKRIHVSEDSTKGRSLWSSPGAGEPYHLCRAQREVLLGSTSEVAISARGERALTRIRDELASTVDPAGNVLQDQEDDRGTRFWTWAGQAANATLAGALGTELGVKDQYMDLPPGVGVSEIREVDVTGAVPVIDERAVTVLKFSSAVPRNLALKAISARVADEDGARQTAAGTIVRRIVG